MASFSVSVHRVRFSFRNSIIHIHYLHTTTAAFVFACLVIQSAVWLAFDERECASHTWICTCTCTFPSSGHESGYVSESIFGPVSVHGRRRMVPRLGRTSRQHYGNIERSENKKEAVIVTEKHWRIHTRIPQLKDADAEHITATYLHQQYHSPRSWKMAKQDFDEITSWIQKRINISSRKNTLWWAISVLDGRRLIICGPKTNTHTYHQISS